MMALDFDASAAVSPAESLRQLKESMGASAGGDEKEEKDESAADADEKEEKADEVEDEDEAPPGAKVESHKAGKKGQEEEEKQDDEETPETRELAGKFAKSPLLTKMLKEAGGDPDKLAERLLEQASSNKKLHDRLSSIEEKLTVAEEEEEEEVVHPDLAAVDADIKDFETEISENKQEQSGLVAKGEKLREEIGILKGQAASDPDRKDVVEDKIDVRKDRLDALAEKWKSLDKRNKNLEREITYAGKRKEDLNRQVDKFKSDRKTHREQAKAWRLEQKRTFDEAVKGLTKVYKMGEDDVEYLHDVIKAEASLYLRSKSESDEAIDLKAFVQQRAAVHAKRLNLRNAQELKKKTEEKLQSGKTVGQPAAGPKPRPAAVTPHSPPGRRLVGQEAVRAAAKQARLHAQKTLGG